MTTQLEQAARLEKSFNDAKRDERHWNLAETRFWLEQYKLIAEQAITALRAALSDNALDRMAENERELGIQMQPAQDCQHCGGTGDVSGEYPGVACPECTGTGVKTQPEFIKHEEGEDGWSEWVCPDPKSYLMKCCDCGLVHEAEFKVVRYKSETEREVCEPVDDPNLQAVFRMRRSEQWSPVDTAHRAGGLPMEQPAQDESVGEVECIDWDEDGQPSAWLKLYDEVQLGDKLYTRPQKPAQDEPCPKCNGLGYYDEGHENDDGSMSGGNYVECEKCKAPAQDESDYTTTRNSWTGRATHKCNRCGRNDFRSEHAAKFHKCEALEQPAQDQPVAWMDGYRNIYSLEEKAAGCEDAVIPLYPRPQAREPLTGEEVTEGCRSRGVGAFRTLAAAFEAGVRFAEAAHGIGEKK